MNFKSLKFLILFFIGIISFSCNKDDDSILLKNDVVKSKKINHISVEQLFQDKGFKQSIEKIPSKTKNYNSKDGETVMEHDYGFTIERYKPANVIETDSIISYTLLITRPNQNDQSVENLVINTNKFTGNISALIIKYVSDSQITNFSNFNGERTITPIVYNPNQYQNSSTGRIYYDCITITYFICTNPNATHLPGEQGCDALPNYITTCGWFDTGSGGAGEGSTGGDTSGTSNGGGGGGTITSPVYTLTPLELAQKDFTKSLSDEQRTWLNGNTDAATDIFAYLAYSDANTGELGYTLSKINYASELINLARLEPNQADVNNLIKISLIIESGNYYENELDDAFFVKIDPYVDLELQNPPTTFHPNLFGIRMYLNYVKLRRLNPDWSKSKCAWYATKDVIHLGLDVFGLIPVAGEVADLINGAIYIVEGDGLNATLSCASAIPIAGWATTTTKFGLKVINSTQTAYTISTKVKLVWKVSGNVITFGSRGQLRKVLGMAVSSIDPRQAHHLIPWATQAHEVIQKAAKSGSAFHMNEALNGIAVAAWRNQPNHDIYNNIIINKLEAFKRSNPNATPQECYNFLQDLIGQIRTWIVNHPNSHLNEIVLP